jgi:hypothetical protein
VVGWRELQGAIARALQAGGEAVETDASRRAYFAARRAG